jgi:plasmid stabilization system protein ParE
VRISWLRRALLDLDAAEAYIAREDPQAASGVVLGVVRAVTLLRDQPGLGRPGRLPGTRELVVPKTPFIVPYRVRGEAVEILRVYHTARKWPERL